MLPSSPCSRCFNITKMSADDSSGRRRSRKRLRSSIFHWHQLCFAVLPVLSMLIVFSLPKVDALALKLHSDQCFRRSRAHRERRSIIQKQMVLFARSSADDYSMDEEEEHEYGSWEDTGKDEEDDEEHKRHAESDTIQSPSQLKHDDATTAAIFVETQLKIEQQQKQIDTLLQMMEQQAKGGPAVSPPSPSTTEEHRTWTSSTATTPSPQAIVPLKAMLFIDGTWLYYSLHERKKIECPILQQFGRGWQFRYHFDWAALPRILCESLQDPGWSAGSPQRPIEIVRASVFTSYKADTPPTSLRYKMFEEMKAVQYDVHMMETVGRSEKCVDIQLAVEMLHFATVPNAYDVALLLTGDKDFMPAMIRVRQKGRKVGLVSMRAGCNRALRDNQGLKDYEVVWLEDHLDKLIIPNSAEDLDGHTSTPASKFTFMKVLNDFIRESGFPKVTSRDIGRYLKFLRIGEQSVLDNLKLAYGAGLRQFLSDSGVYNIEHRDSESFREDPTDKAYWVSLRRNANDRLLEEAKTTTLSKEEKEFFSNYSLALLRDKETAYFHSCMVYQSRRSSSGRQPESPDKVDETLELPEELTRDYSQYKVAELKGVCRERGLTVSGTKAVLLERIQADVDEEIARLQNEFDAKRKPQFIDINGAQPLRPMVPQKVASYLEELVIEVLKASGGKASSRNVGRYLAANKPSKAGSASHESALQELKTAYGSLGGFVTSFPDTFDKDDSPPEEDGREDNPSKFAFSILLRQEPTRV